MIRTLIALVPADKRGTLGLYTVLTVLSVVIRAAGTVLLVPLVAALFGDTPQDAWPWLGWLTAATAAGWIVDTTTSRLGFDLGFAVLDHTQHDVADRMPNIRLDWLTAENTATARAAIASTGPELVGLVVNLLTPLIGAVLLPAAIAVALVAVSPPLGLAALAGVVVLLGAMWASNRLSRKADTVADETNSAFTERIIEFARTQQALRAARRVEPARSLVGDALGAQHGAGVRLLAMQIPGQLLFSLASQLALILLAGMATWLTVRGELSVPEAVAMIVVVARYLEPFTSLSELTPAIESTRGTLGRIRAVLDAPTLTAGDAAPADTKSAPRIEFDCVTFGYGDHPVLDDVSFVLEPGSTTAIVGPSGSGKSTILSLIAGLHQPTEGRVLIDGVDAASLDDESRRAATSVVFQQPYLFDGSIRDNILVGDPGADEDRLAAAVRLARVDELTARLPNGDASKVGEAGAALSGGERQRVSIARALVKPAPVLLVDEATSALDTENEAAVVDALTADLRHRTRVIVAHRLASIRHADRVLFLDGGRIVEDGTIDGLLAAGGRFDEFWRRQHEAADWQITH
ncbi:mycobactin import ATP-binding/permease protein IrtB [Mycolicibacterium smegmatis]|uniref:Mycobactin import ATP-binding/permease protein IrtB n=3 Tax=Mycolicibacterium smegmatis TaxID=1772 RepID=IRTB_MYCS2|nr:mycobactin import ATP-binding/permease protein IrtB [Mycolicibacterium smegmatis]A0R6H7.1 RecName: Full=Mycobactin import ATP-binding/permease protein IrtB [Mycolicibacterium smegmatis MC2 155]ABK71448.1 ABC transporter ATP-binding protein [Mycolicibacterium smegmatis MC2 155]AFP42802.1 Transmembrane ATP-binding protein ABC transporter [Mycolicibacterium smegmatis MC2 155]AIU11527.1 iron ABC transporter permease [Mycolicibacterium smegmatis MC2 155]AIU18152.1 iron ABC transporter permease [